MVDKIHNKLRENNFFLDGDRLVAIYTKNKWSRTYAKPNFLLLEEFISPGELSQLWEFVISKKHELRPSRVYKPGLLNGEVDRDYRRSKVLSDLGSFRSFFVSMIRNRLPLVFEKLEIKPFKVGKIDAQITATNDGEFFKPHIDNGGAPQSRRIISYVFYFYKEPKSYSGGQLRLYEPGSENARSNGKKKYKTVTPKQNTIVFFNSSVLHEVTRVKCPSGAFEESRFTLNGWIYK